MSLNYKPLYNTMSIRVETRFGIICCLEQLLHQFRHVSIFKQLDQSNPGGWVLQNRKNTIVKKNYPQSG